MLNNIRIFFFYTDFGKIVVTDNKHDGNNCIVGYCEYHYCLSVCPSVYKHDFCKKAFNVTCGDIMVMNDDDIMVQLWR